MVHSCIVCKRVDHLNPNLSFHRCDLDSVTITVGSDFENDYIELLEEEETPVNYEEFDRTTKILATPQIENISNEELILRKSKIPLLLFSLPADQLSRSVKRIELQNSSPLNGVNPESVTLKAVTSTDVPEKISLRNLKTPPFLSQLPADKSSGSAREIIPQKYLPPNIGNSKNLSLKPVSCKDVPEEIRQFMQKYRQVAGALASKTNLRLRVKSENQITNAVALHKATRVVGDDDSKKDVSFLEPSSEGSPVTNTSKQCSITLIVDSDEDCKLNKPLYVSPFKPPFNCPVCELNYEYFDELESHLQSSEESHSYRCVICLKCCNNYDEFCEHMVLHKNCKYECTICKIIHIGFKDYHRHLRNHKKMVLVHCTSCDESFFYQWALDNHNKKYHGFSCKKCDLHFHSEFNLFEHNRRKHYFCEVCHKVFDAADPLFDHEEEEHSGCITCPICQQILPDIDSLKEHKMKVHETEVSLLCSTCGRMFKNKYCLKQHLKLHDRENEDNYWPCDKCDKVFEFETYLKGHQIRKHSGRYISMCEICGKTLSSPYLLVRHKMAHDGIKPEECDICHKRFRRRTHLRNHRRTHTGERPYECNICGQKYTVPHQLSHHMKTKHADRHNTFDCEYCDKKFPTNVSRDYHIKKKHEFADENLLH